MKRSTASSAAVLLLLAATLTACGDAPDDCDDAAPMAYMAVPERPSGGSKGGKSRSTSKAKNTKSTPKSKSKPKTKHRSHHDGIDVCDDD